MRACTPAPLLELLRNKVLRAGPAGLTAGGVTSIDTLDIFGVVPPTLHVNISAFHRVGLSSSPKGHAGSAARPSGCPRAAVSRFSLVQSNIKYKVLGIK